jgi:NTP pyrophosphatase (non-canonical NTP hydrolase)
MSGYTTLRKANSARQKEWDKDDKIGLSYRGNELAGEIGEAFERAVDIILIGVASGRASNFMKKLDRERLGIRGSRATLEQLAEELADVIICCDLVAMHEGINLEEAVRNKFNATSEKMNLQTRMVKP